MRRYKRETGLRIFRDLNTEIRTRVSFVVREGLKKCAESHIKIVCCWTHLLRWVRVCVRLCPPVLKNTIVAHIVSTVEASLFDATCCRRDCCSSLYGLRKKKSLRSLGQDCSVQFSFEFLFLSCSVCFACALRPFEGSG